MSHILSNDRVELHLDLPGENYRAARFDWTGKVTRVLFDKIPLCTTERKDSLPRDLFGKGFYNEFGIDSPLGFEEAQPGDWVHKIGVGLLKKDERPYSFTHAYELRPATFEVFPSTEQVEIHCTSEWTDGIAYKLIKKIGLFEAGFYLDYHLINRGEKSIETDEYVHNFLAMDEQPMGVSYKLSFPFNLAPGEVGESVNPESKIELGQDKLGFNDGCSEQFFFSHLSANKEVEAQWTLTDEKSRLSISERGNFSTDKVNLWGWGHVICPELFFKIHLLPGQSTSWRRTYHIEQVQA